MTEKTALLVIDVQVSMFAEPGNLPHEGERVVANIRDLIGRARAAGIDVNYVRHDHARHKPMQRGQPGFEIRPEIAPEPGDLIFDKRACDAFYDTGLQESLRARGIDHVVIAGLQTEMCVDTACRSALHRDFNVTLAGDAHTTWTRDDVTAEQIINHHNYALGNVPHPTKEILVRPTAEIVF
jgi:nicotinamidase-related amidase